MVRHPFFAELASHQGRYVNFNVKSCHLRAQQKPLRSQKSQCQHCFFQPLIVALF